MKINPPSTKSYLSIALFWILCCQIAGCAKQPTEAEKYAEMVETLTEKGSNLKLILDNLFLDIKTQAFLPGWEIDKIKLVENHCFYYVTSTSGSVADLQRWAAEHYYFVNIDHNGIALVKSIENIAVVKEAKLMNLSSVSGYLLDAMSFAFPSKPSPIFEQDSEFNDKAFFTRNVKIPIKEYSPEDLVDLGTLLDGLPISFSFAEFKLLPGSQRIDGEITLLMLGTVS